MPVTPYRFSRLVIDLPDYTLLEAPAAIERNGREIARGSPADTGSDNVHLLATGAWAIEPLQEKQHHITERTDTTGAVLHDTDFNLAPGIIAAYRFRNPASDLTGVTSDPSVADRGDPFLVKTVPAGDSWQKSLDSDISSFGQASAPTQNISMDRLAVSTATHPQEQPYYFRFEVPATKQHSPDYIVGYYFGGPAADDGSGQYGVLFSGDGVATLSEKVNGVWTNRDLWRYCEPHRISNTSHSVRIWPHRGVGAGAWIEFRASMTESSPSGGFAISTKSYFPTPQAPRTHVYQVKGAPGRATVTGPGQARVDVRRDQRVQFQVSLLRYQQNGTLVDWTFAIPFSISSNLTLYWTARMPDGTSLVGRLYDATTGDELTEVSRDTNSAVYAPNQNVFHYYAKFFFTASSDQSQTPLLYSYHVGKDGVIGSTSSELTPVEVPTNGGILRAVNITGPESDPTHETATISLEDVNESFPQLLLRANQHCAVDTDYGPHPGQRSRLIEGYAVRNVGRRRGNTGQQYPSELWRSYELTFMPMWQRLSRALTFARLNLNFDPAVPPDSDGNLVGPKVTDTIRRFINYAGFPLSMIDVPDDPLRFFASGSQDAKALLVEPLTPIGDLVLKWARDWLGAFLLWDANAGSSGMWRLRRASTAPYQNLWNFTTSSPTPGIPTESGTYGSPNWVGFGGTAFMRKGSLSTWTMAPEANAVQVVCLGPAHSNGDGQTIVSNWAVNWDSLQDPSSVDFIGTFVPVVIVDLSVNTKLPEGQSAADFLARRYYDFVCHAIKMGSFEAPLVLVVDPNDTMQNTARPLRFYDPVLIDGNQWLIRNCNPNYRKDSLQMAQYEVEAPRI